MKRLLLLLLLFVAGSPASSFWWNQEPWATAKGDARTDCAVYKTKNKRHDSFQAAEDRARDFALGKAETMQSQGMTLNAIDEWWASDENPLPEAEIKEDKAYAEVQLAAINVAKHLEDASVTSYWH